MAGFRIGRGRDNRTPQQHPQQGPYGNAAPPPYTGPQQQWHQGQHQGHPQGQHQGQQQYGEPEYFGDPYQQQHSAAPHDPYAANNPGHTRAFSIHDEAYAGGPDAYGDGATYQAGAAAAPAGPRLHWKQLLSGIVMRPGPTFYQMRDHAVWGPALVVTFLYGLLALFGFDQAREEAINATLSTAIPYVLVTGVMFVVGGLIMGAVTHTLARQLGGDGAWQPTVGLSMLIMAMTDAPRLLFALFLGGENTLVQVIGWLSWLAAGALFTSMVRTSHDLPWPKALGASAIQLVALLSLIKLGTI
ncbi:YIP1 family protein [Streptomyces sp. WAC05374]|uniref:Yip1 family protein n=1 Tax=Streptomyces sp. WAC05374 TaxID=2487420 RepID=UPI000F869F6F|nr:Yip1 family protein [Streptomyces sp. WAC05374]RST09185.1 YIP1 family protein [Streptomyces sp. WAC05374]TDF44761.1 YIP1 family protein [Streptomyces sp. WAC05374]TDF56001.1 YIP1 family protein [Streptomyces sp. WAC05374]TDF59826.1 YIP1 family protein [Streptomyces sp. WAC05374]